MMLFTNRRVRNVSLEDTALPPKRGKRFGGSTHKAKMTVDCTHARTRREHVCVAASGFYGDKLVWYIRTQKSKLLKPLLVFI